MLLSARCPPSVDAPGSDDLPTRDDGRGPWIVRPGSLARTFASARLTAHWGGGEVEICEDDKARARRGGLCSPLGNGPLAARHQHQTPHETICGALDWDWPAHSFTGLQPHRGLGQ